MYRTAIGIQNYVISVVFISMYHIYKFPFKLYTVKIAAGFHRNKVTVTAVNDSAPKGAVLSTTPDSGEPCKPDADIRLVVSSGFQDVTISLDLPDTGAPVSLKFYVAGKEDATLSSQYTNILPRDLGKIEFKVGETKETYTVTVKIAGDGNTTFADYSLHTLKFFYLERGAAISNCKIRFNIPVLPSGSLSVQKQFHGVSEYDENYEFMLYDVTSNTPASNTKYVIGDTEFYTDMNGLFNLKKDEVATFILTNYHKYYVKETHSGDYAVPHSCTLNGSSCESINQTNEFMIEPESAHQAIFTNQVKRFNLKVSKIAYSDSPDEAFEFRLTLKNKDGNPIQIPDNISSVNNYNIDNTNGTITYNLKNEESITLNDIPINTSISLKELKHDGYQTVIKSGDTVLSENDTYSFVLDSDKDITVHNIPGVVLPETGGSGIWIYIFLGLLLYILLGWNLISLIIVAIGGFLFYKQ